MDMCAERWLPPHLARPEQVVGLLLVMSLPSGCAFRLADYSGDPGLLRKWFRTWLVERAEALAARRSTELGAEASFLCLTSVADENEQSPFQLGEFSYGTYPAAPEEWIDVEMRSLLSFAIKGLD